MAFNDELAINSNFNTDDGYHDLLEIIKNQFNSVCNLPLYYVDDPDNLLKPYDIFLAFLPTNEDGKHYNCHTCRKFINKYGRLVYLDKEYKIHSALFGFSDEYIREYIPEKFRKSIIFMRNAIELRKISSPFIVKSMVYGVPEAGGFDHFHINGKYRYDSKDLDEIVLNHTCLKNAVPIFSLKNCKMVQKLMDNGVLSRGDKFEHYIGMFIDIKEAFENEKDEKVKENMYWAFANRYPQEICNIKNTPIGLLLQRLTDGDMEIDDAVREFNKVVDPLNYQRPKSAPSIQNVLQAERKIKELNLENSLKRRFANLEDIPEEQFIWKPMKVSKPSDKVEIFKDLMKDVEKCNTSSIYPSKLISGSIKNVSLLEFLDMIKSKQIKNIFYDPNAFKPSGYYKDANFCGFITEAVSGSTPIITWDSEEKRNPFSWYMYTDSKHGAYEFNIRNRTKVTGIIRLPNKWNESKDPLGFDGYIFFMEGCKDINKEKGLALFPEILRKDIFDIRKTIEKYSDNGNIENRENPTAGAGLLFGGTYNGFDNVFMVDDSEFSYLYRIVKF